MRGCKCKGAVLSGTSLGVSLLPKGTCPLCWPAYAALLSAVGVRADILNRYLFPLTAALVGLGLLAIGWRARQRNGYGPVIMATLASTGLLSGKFLLRDPAVFYSGLVLFGIASVWNVLPRRAIPLIAMPSHESVWDGRSPTHLSQGCSPGHGVGGPYY